jgi:hypothetical protein
MDAPIGLCLLASDTVTPRRGFGWPGFVVALCDDVVMTLTASPDASVVRPAERLEVLFEELGASWRSSPRWTARSCVG